MSIKQELAIIAKIIKANLSIIKLVSVKLSEVQNYNKKELKKLALIHREAKL